MSTSAASPARRTALVTGATSGIGLAVAKLLVSRGYRVIGTSRNPDTIAPANRVAGVEYVALDLGDPASVDSAFERIGDVDVLVNNAGESQSGPLEELTRDAIERLFQVNVISAVRLTSQFTPGMRERRVGRVVMVGSMLGSFPVAYRSSYVATKAAIKGFATAARRELSPYGVWLTTVEPGSINTGISERRTHYLADGSPFTDEYRTVIKHLNANEAKGIPAEKVAETILRAIEADAPRSLYAVGSNAPVVFLLKRIMPSGVVEAMVNRRHGLR
jgi:short-subunit dehydrogenase